MLKPGVDAAIRRGFAARAREFFKARGELDFKATLTREVLAVRPVGERDWFASVRFYLVGTALVALEFGLRETVIDLNDPGSFDEFDAILRRFRSGLDDYRSGRLAAEFPTSGRKARRRAIMETLDRMGCLG